MNRYLKEFLHRGLIFAGFGPIVVGIVFAILQYTVKDFSLGGVDVLTAIASTYLLAFIQAGASVFNQIEHWPPAKALGIHFSTLFLSYSLCYILNRWIPFDIKVILIFAGIFTIVYALTYTAVFLCVRAASKKMNSRLA
ncbi:MAG: DUF3021 domain-containing protein [Clostridia bacterium]|nr:DUF3021 domain-containing protein [Clostridia bacterium]